MGHKGRLKQYLEERYGPEVTRKKVLQKGKDKIRKYFNELKEEIHEYIESSSGDIEVAVDHEGHLADFRIEKKLLTFTGDEEKIWVFRVDVQDPKAPKSTLIDELSPSEKKCINKRKEELDSELLDSYVNLLIEE